MIQADTLSEHRVLQVVVMVLLIKVLKSFKYHQYLMVERLSKLDIMHFVIQQSHQFSFLKISNAGDAAFYQCESLEEIRFAANSQLETIGTQFFSGNFYN